MIPLIALIAIAALVIWIVPVVATTAARTVARTLDLSRTPGSIDQSLVEARLVRIEEAIDAMALQIERLSEHQRALLGQPAAPQVVAEPEPARVERPQ